MKSFSPFVASVSIYEFLSKSNKRKKFEDAGEMSGIRVTVVTMKNEPWLHLRATCLMFVDASHCPKMSVSELIFFH